METTTAEPVDAEAPTIRTNPIEEAWNRSTSEVTRFLRGELTAPQLALEGVKPEEPGPRMKECPICRRSIGLNGMGRHMAAHARNNPMTTNDEIAQRVRARCRATLEDALDRMNQLENLALPGEVRTLTTAISAALDSLAADVELLGAF